jgi:hypothetical protein
MKWPLPPKRFESVLSTKFDPIRGRPWFKRLERRKWQLNALQLAAQRLSYPDKGVIMTQDQASKEFGVDPRELRDYVKFISGIGRERPSHAYQHILDTAYAEYCRFSASVTLRHYIELEAPKWGINPRRVVELWEVDSTFLPTNL